MGRSRKILLSFIIIIIIGCGFMVTSFNSLLFQEGNPFPLLVSAIKLHLTDSEYVQFAKSEKRVRFLSVSKAKNHYNIVKKWMNSRGWDYKEQMGSGLIFTKNGEDAIVEVRQYSSKYFVWEIQKSYFGNT
ncbi:hypothetical protein [Neobacillus mesonae]|uniref:hypothetical protein n=1 Tax=Neobacillus mesonae TaxID=1193713 RepID=UPI002041EBE6|nr:hypothetical protein [Neobacillus mesonae]MCM3567669.1 hypothetical protein [Neobacillus mesonae]